MSSRAEVDIAIADMNARNADRPMSPKDREAMKAIFRKLERAAERGKGFTPSRRFDELFSECRRHEKEHLAFGKRLVGHVERKASVEWTAMAFACKAIVEAPKRPPRTWAELDRRSDYHLGAIVAEQIREIAGPTLGLTKAERALVLAFDYVKDVAVR